MNAQRQCHEDLVQVSIAILGVDTQQFEAEKDELELLLACMRDHVSAAISVLERVIAAFERGPERDPSETIYDSSSVPLVDIALIAHAYLRQRSERIRRLGRSPYSWLVNSESASLRRHVLDSLVRVEQAMCKKLGITARLADLNELDAALASRKVYQRYIRSIRKVGDEIEDGQRSMVAALRRSASHIDRVSAHDVQAQLPGEDRRMLSSLQSRIAATVQQSDDELSVRRLWKDIRASAARFARVHEREVLQQHDLELLAALLGDGVGPLCLDESTRARLSLLEGRDAEVDRLLAAESCPEPELRARLIELHDQLARSLGCPLMAPALGRLEHAVELCAL